ncbi:MAG: MaoC/PaaZ C-terminal domain-containing protein, partial [Chloroflexi bacterium]|nr:MaoC/PaaZ C-terminal domain-containing protein [Chloroflexota bacterium]
SEVTALNKIATTRMLVQYAGASGDFNPLHYEDDFARNLVVGRPIVHGLLKRSWLVNLVTDWIGEK